jgi:hypothetical protein
MKPSRIVVHAVARSVLLVMTAFTLVVAARVLGEPLRSARARLVEPVAAEEVEDGLTADPPSAGSCPRLPPGHPPVGNEALPPGHPPIDSGVRTLPLLSQDGTSTI